MNSLFRNHCGQAGRKGIQTYSRYHRLYRQRRKGLHAGNRSGELQSPRVVPVHLAHLARRVGYRERIPVGIVNVMIMPDLRGCRRVVAVLVQTSERIRLCHLTRIHLLFLGERLVHNAIGHIQSIRRRFGLFVFRNQMIDVVVDR